MGTLRFNPQTLFLSADPQLVRAQLAGVKLSLDQARPLRDDISTDEISPLSVMVYFDSTLGRFPYTGFKAGGEFPIGSDAIRNACSEVVVGGARYGKGSSREHSVVAEREAGIRLVRISTSTTRYWRGPRSTVCALRTARPGSRARQPSPRARSPDHSRRSTNCAVASPRRVTDQSSRMPLVRSRAR